MDPSTSKLTFAALLTFLTVVPACDNDISSSSRLRRPRLLAVQAEPPNPAFGQSTTLRPLVYLPPGESVTYEWSWCPVPTTPDDGYKCPVDQAAVDSLSASTGLANIPPLFLGDTETIEIRNPFPPALLASLCAGDNAATDLFFGGASTGKSAQTYSCTPATLPMQVMLTIRGSISDTGVVSLRLPIDDTTPGNSNPIITGVSVALPEPARRLDDSGVVVVPRDKKVKLHAEVDPAQVEPYLDRQIGPDDQYVKDDKGQYVLGPTAERLTVYWFSEGGGFVDRSTSWAPSDLDSHGQPLAFAAGMENDWSTPKVADYAAASSLVLVVVRDSRGGVAWTHGIATLEDAP
jgi:hypothetical protein